MGYSRTRAARASLHSGPIHSSSCGGVRTKERYCDTSLATFFGRLGKKDWPNRCMGLERSQSRVDEPGNRLFHHLLREAMLYSEQKKEWGAYTSNPLSGLARIVPVNFPRDALNEPRFNAMALPKPPIV